MGFYDDSLKVPAHTSVDIFLKMVKEKISEALKLKDKKGHYDFNTVRLFVYCNDYDNSQNRGDYYTHHKLYIKEGYYAKNLDINVYTIDTLEVPGETWNQRYNRHMNTSNSIKKELKEFILENNFKQGSDLEEIIFRDKEYELNGTKGIKIPVSLREITIKCKCGTEFKVPLYNSLSIEKTILDLSVLFDKNDIETIKNTISKKLMIDISILNISTNGGKKLIVTAFNKDGISKTISGAFRYSPVDFINRITNMFNDKNFIAIPGHESINIINITENISNFRRFTNGEMRLVFPKKDHMYFYIPENFVDVIYSRYAELTSEEDANNMRLMAELGLVIK